MSLKKLQEKIGVTADGAFGPATLKAAMVYYKMTPERAAHFFAQTSHETGGFKLFVENLNYSAKGLQSIFGKYFPGNLEESYARQPEKIASRVYANRMGNGNESSMEGWIFRGRGAIQTTGKSNYKSFSDSIKKPEIMTNPELVGTDYAFESAMFFFTKNKIWDVCDKGVSLETITRVSRIINGGTNGLEDRIEKTNLYYSWLKK
jgi:putative chitinase